MANIWVLEVFDREDEYCEYDSEIVGVYTEGQIDKALIDFYDLCDSRTQEGDRVELWRRNDDYHFRSECGEYEDYKLSCVSLCLKKTKSGRKEAISFEEMEKRLTQKAEGIDDEM